jgi:hypothetical protein
VAPGPSCLFLAFAFAPQKDFTIPSSRFGQRGVTPAFGYGAPHPSAGGTLTLLIHALLSAHYGPVRLPATMQSAPVIPCWLPPPVTIPADEAGSPRFRHDPFARDMALDPGGAMAPRDCGTTHVAFGAHDGLGPHNVVISWLNPIPHAITVYASDPALPRRPQHSLPGGSLRLTRTGFPPVGSCQLCLAHRPVIPRSVQDQRSQPVSNIHCGFLAHQAAGLRQSRPVQVWPITRAGYPPISPPPAWHGSSPADV